MNPTNDPSGEDLRWRPGAEAGATQPSAPPAYPAPQPTPTPTPTPAAPMPPRRGSARGMSGRVIGGIAVVAAVFAAGGFGAGYVVASNNAPTPNPLAAAAANGGFGGFNGGQGGTGGGGQGAGNGAARAAFGNGAAGTISSVSPTQLTLTTQGNGSRIVLLTPQTTITKVTSSTEAAASLQSGDTVTVRGTANPDGSITAQAVILRSADLFGGRGFGPRGSAAPSPSTAP